MIPLFALFQRRIEGDDALLQLARLRFEQAGLSAEVHAGAAPELEWMLRLAPSTPYPPMVHLPRDLDLLAPDAPRRVAALARRFGPRVSGFVVHDRRWRPDRLPDLVAVAGTLSAVLAASGPARLSIEYAAGLTAEQFVAIGAALRDVERVGLCVDIGHVGIRQARWEFARRRPESVRDLADWHTSDPDLPEVIGDVQAAVASGLGVVLELITALGAQGKPVHFHLHDGHPLIRGLSDHFGFLLRVPVPFGHEGQASLDPLYGVTGLRQITGAVARALGPDRASFTLEIHEHQGQLPLQDAVQHFARWQDLTNAERMNLWLRELAENATLVRAGQPATGRSVTGLSGVALFSG
jgi:hypothetical protein